MTLFNIFTIGYFCEQEKRSVELGVWPMQLFHFWSRDVRSVQNLLLCTKFRESQMIFFTEIWRYNDFQNVGHPPSWNCFTTIQERPPTKSLLLVAAACQIPCQSDTHCRSEACILLFFATQDIAIILRKVKDNFLAIFTQCTIPRRS